MGSPYFQVTIFWPPQWPVGLNLRPRFIGEGVSVLSALLVLVDGPSAKKNHSGHGNGEVSQQRKFRGECLKIMIITSCNRYNPKLATLLYFIHSKLGDSDLVETRSASGLQLEDLDRNVLMILMSVREPETSNIKGYTA